MRRRILIIPAVAAAAGLLLGACAGPSVPANPTFSRMSNYCAQQFPGGNGSQYAACMRAADRLPKR